MQLTDLPSHEIPALDGNNAPIQSEDVFTDLPVIGTVPSDFSGMYVRNGPNAYYPPQWRYHAYDGDGMLHAVQFNAGKVTYRNRWIQTSGFQEEVAAGQALWTGLKESPRKDTPNEPLKNTSNTDVKFHAGRLVSMWYRSGMPYSIDPYTLETIGTSDFDGAIKRISAHSRPDENTGELIYFDYGDKRPYFEYGVIGPDRKLKHKIEITLPQLSLPHDMAVTTNYSILHDFPLRLDPEALKVGRYKVRFVNDQESRFAVVPRYGSADQVRWFTAKPNYMLHVINAWEENDEIVMVGTPYRLHLGSDGLADARRLEQTIHLRQRDFILYEWRFNLSDGSTKERVIDDVLNAEFPIINSAYQGKKNQYSYHIMFPPGGKEEPRFPGLVKFRIDTGGYIAYSDGPRFFYNEPGFAPRDNPVSEDDGYLITLVWDPIESRSEIQIFDCLKARLAEGPVARIVLPRRVPNGFHATFVSQKNLDRWKA